MIAKYKLLIAEQYNKQTNKLSGRPLEETTFRYPAHKIFLYPEKYPMKLYAADQPKIDQLEVIIKKMRYMSIRQTIKEKYSNSDGEVFGRVYKIQINLSLFLISTCLGMV